jgi:anti-sigma regulatory factor (Ser/Thr protein kinase)
VGIWSLVKMFKVTVPASPGVLLNFRHSLRAWLHTAELGSGAVDALVLAVHEAVANGIEHGSGSPVRVEGSVEDGDLVVEITSRGSWNAGSDGDGPLAERGRGLALMRALTEMELLVDDGCVTIRLRPSQT